MAIRDNFPKAIRKRGCKISMDGRGAWRDNAFVKRLWDTVRPDSPTASVVGRKQRPLPWISLHRLNPPGIHL